MMYPYPDIFDDLISKVKVDIKASDPLPKYIERMSKEIKEEEYENSERETERKS